MKKSCPICFHHCALENGEIGFCRARKNQDGVIIPINYGKITSISLDPIEKKPLRQFYPGKKILSVGSFGCNLRCPFCQNYEISMAEEKQCEQIFCMPEELAEKAEQLVPRGNIGLAYTYNEPLVGYEFVRDCAEKIHAKSLKNVLVTNGTICKEPLQELLPLIDAANVDLKAFTPQFYEKIAGNLEVVKETIQMMADHCHLEVTTLVIPGENDGIEEMKELSFWLSSVRCDIPLHITRFFPRYQFENHLPTPVETIERLCETAREFLEYVYPGNC